MSGTLRLRGSTSGYSELTAPAVAGDQTFILPATGGTLLTTDNPAPTLTLESGTAASPSLTFEGDSDTGLYSPAGNTLAITTSGTEHVRIDSDGLKFNGDTAAANALDDYEEGTWVPQFAAGSGFNGTQTGTGSYVKVGKKITVWATVSWSSTGSGSTGAIKFNLPFVNRTYRAAGTFGYVNGIYLTTNNHPPGLTSTINTSDCMIWLMRDQNTPATTGYQVLTSTGEIQWSMSYETD